MPAWLGLNYDPFCGTLNIHTTPGFLHSKKQRHAMDFAFGLQR